MAHATRLDTNMSHWADGTRHYSTDDGYLAVEAYTPECCHVVPQGAAPMINELLAVLGEGRQAVKHVVRPTVVFACNEEGLATDLTPLHKFPPGTSHEDALEQLGYTVD
ncbi:minor tail protein [Mycobacterium phage Sheen]|uniref:Minor tail protein n=1 Tax=Mycobacterium phage Sheen TaxID=1589274 RepID=A0A0B5A5W5_9CAUD|nr:minor tail protein [Mycobacterium phage Sheen]AJD82451.1 minor tail protein [Mycobacterium phage Sheen]